MISRPNHFPFTSWIKLLLNNRQGHQRRERMESKEWNTKKATRGGFMWNKCDKCCKYKRGFEKPIERKHSRKEGMGVGSWKVGLALVWLAVTGPLYGTT